MLELSKYFPEAAISGPRSANQRLRAVNKTDLTEQEIRTRHITPAIVQHGGWDLHTQVREEVLLRAGRIDVRGTVASRNTKSRAFADYVLYLRPNIPLAVVEAKDNRNSVGAGMQQALRYAELLGVPFAYSSNGDAFLEHDLTGLGPSVEREIPLEQSFPLRKNFGSVTKPGRGWTRKAPASSAKISTMTAPAKPRATTNSTPSTAPSRPSPEVSGASCW